MIRNRVCILSLPTRSPHGLRSPKKRPVDVPKSFLEVVAQKLEDTVQPIFGLGFAMKDASHDAMWTLSSLEAHRTFTNEINGQLFHVLTLTLTLGFFFSWARRGVEGKARSCRPHPSTPHVPVLALNI